ncbi:HAD family hydrolase [Fulvimarina endophytica]|uniref:phosphoglycolate phosphatase n=1 Tax=Fulvimarina endophytica TaxID=2293836 RepID=A0A371WXT9_9HYPH|nr:HAD family hydrolase [Fulvimarina endophytica]RFC61781.1 HAD family hydrolase [Fulvimarina endophytica]
MNALPPTIRAILFDKDGTLLDYHRSWGPINRRAALLAAAGDADLAAHLLKLGGMDAATGITRADSLLGSGNTREIAEAWRQAGAPPDQETLVSRLDALFLEGADEAVPVTDLPALFGRLSASGLRLGIASMDGERAIRRFAERTGMAPHVDFVAGYDSGYGVKPSGGMLTAFATAVAIAPANIAVVGDNLHDMEMGRAGGAILRIAVLSGTGTRETLTDNCDLCIDHIGELDRLLVDV